MSNPRVLLLGGHGKIARLLTPLLLNRSWDVTSVIRNPDHTSDILKLGQGKKGKVEVLVSSLDDVKSVDDAKAIVDRAKPDYVVWAAGMSVSLFYIYIYIYSHIQLTQHNTNPSFHQAPAAKADPSAPTP